MAAVRSSVLFGALSRVLFYLLLFAGVLVGCGKTGPLYLPDETRVGLQGNISAEQPTIAYNTALFLKR